MAQHALTTADDPELLAALADAPEGNSLAGLRLELTPEKARTTALIAEAIKSEYKHLSGSFGSADSYTLKELFAALETRL